MSFLHGTSQRILCFNSACIHTTAILWFLILSLYSSLACSSKQWCPEVGEYREHTIYFNISSEWGTVCDDFGGLLDATVARKQMGFVGVNNSDSFLFGSGASSQNILLDNVTCRGSESWLIDCNYDDHTADCNHSEDVGVVWSNGELGWGGSLILYIQYRYILIYILY